MSQRTAPATAAQQMPEHKQSGSEEDALESLHKMSTTAGLGTQDYVAINPFAIAAIFLGLASALALIGDILLVIPLAGIVCGLVAWRQVRHSNGTQAGLGLAIGGIVLSIALAGVAIGQKAVVYWQHGADRQEIIGLIDQLSTIVGSAENSSQPWEQAYQLFDQPFQLRTSETSFVSRWKSLQNTLGAIKAFQWNGTSPYFEEDPATGEMTATALVLIEFKDPTKEVGRYPMTFRQIGTTWKIDNFPILFPETPPEGPGAPGSPLSPGGHGHAH